MKEYYVYKHESPSGKVYIGMTHDIKKRWKNSGQEYRNNVKFTTEIMKYGWDNFKHIILFDHLTKEEAEIKEIEMIKKYKTTNPTYGFNLTSGGAGVHDHQKYRNVIQYDIEGNYIASFPSIIAAAKSVNAHPSGINKVCHKMKSHKTYKGYIWRFKGDFLELELIKKEKKVAIINTDTLLIFKTFDNVKIASSFLNVNTSTLYKAIKHKERCKNYYVCYLDDYKEYIKSGLSKPRNIRPVIQFDKNMNKLSEYASISEASKSTGILACDISNCIAGRLKTSGGYKWTYSVS